MGINSEWTREFKQSLKGDHSERASIKSHSKKLDRRIIAVETSDHKVWNFRSNSAICFKHSSANLSKHPTVLGYSTTSRFESLKQDEQTKTDLNENGTPR